MDYKGSISYTSQALGPMNKDLVKELGDYYTNKIIYFLIFNKNIISNNIFNFFFLNKYELKYKNCLFFNSFKLLLSKVKAFDNF